MVVSDTVLMARTDLKVFAAAPKTEKELLKDEDVADYVNEFSGLECNILGPERLAQVRNRFASAQVSKGLGSSAPECYILGLERLKQIWNAFA